MTPSGLSERRNLTASTVDMAAFASALAASSPFFLLTPSTSKSFRGQPYFGTTFSSRPPRLPTKVIEVPGSRLLNSSARAMAGKRCPPVPPPANTSLKLLSIGFFFTPKSCSRGPSGLVFPDVDVEYYAYGRHVHHESGAAIAYKRQGQPLRGQKAHDDRHVKRRLKDDHEGQPQGKVLAVQVLCLEGYLYAADQDDDIERYHA